MVNERLLTLKSVVEITGISKSEIYRKMERNDFPKPVKISTRCVRWVGSEIQSWISKYQSNGICNGKK